MTPETPDPPPVSPDPVQVDLHRAVDYYVPRGDVRTLKEAASLSPVEPTPPRCGARHQMTGVVCELQQGHAENHRGEDSHAIAQWPVEPAPPTPAPCVWRVTGGALGNWVAPSCIAESIPAPWGTERATACHLCGKPMEISQ